jgi:hypothetical protein
MQIVFMSNGQQLSQIRSLQALLERISVLGLAQEGGNARMNHGVKARRHTR